MADFPEPMLAGALTLTGLAPVPLAQGVTFAPPAGTVNAGFKIASKAMTAYPLSHTFTVPELQLNVKTAFGYLPYGVTVIGFSVVSADLDSGGTALVQSIMLGDTTMVAGVVTGVAATTGMFACIPTELTAPTVLYMKVTTAATTAAAGAVTIYALYYST